MAVKMAVKDPSAMEGPYHSASRDKGKMLATIQSLAVEVPLLQFVEDAAGVRAVHVPRELLLRDVQEGAVPRVVDRHIIVDDLLDLRVHWLCLLRVEFLLHFVHEVVQLRI